MPEQPPEILTSQMPKNAEISESSVLVGNFVDPSKEQIGINNPEANIEKFLQDDEEGPMAQSIMIVKGKNVKFD